MHPRSVIARGIAMAALLAPATVSAQSGGPNKPPTNEEIVIFVLVVSFWAALAFGTLYFIYKEYHKRLERNNYWRSVPPNQVMARQESPLRTFRAGLCQCWESPRVCVAATFCGPAVAAFNRAELENRKAGILDILASYLGVRPCALVWFNRQSLRTKMQMEPNWAEDCGTSICCVPCAFGQHMLELEAGPPGQIGMDEGQISLDAGLRESLLSGGEDAV